ncbi:hypothetical protein POM88_021265 [Heracleum sosnowskyi]|uniref:Gag-pol polyprotein n=1 Tax=Heracleum sosnowskyi TaxID=360622 RepID=A0AAD8IGK1_9APIA|nr:hypothetical protein POM88_021265 [Heracleum sosnowskyi]
MVKKDAGVKIPVLDKDNYFHWKVKMHLHLMSMDERYVDCIEKGPHVPMKFASRVGLPNDAEDVEIPKLVSEWTVEDVAEVHKDKRTMNILFNGLEQEMFDNVINCTTSKEVWDTVRTLCEGTEQVRENKMFEKLLNGLKLYGRIYQTKDSNLKFLRALPKEWKPMTVSLRNTQEYKDYTLERLYGTLKTYELEMEQDEEIEKVQKKGGSIALIASVNQLEDDIEETAKATTSRASCRSDVSKGKGKMTEEEQEPANLDDLDEIDEHIAFLSRKFSKFKFKRNSEARPPRRDFQPSKNN